MKLETLFSALLKADQLMRDWDDQLRIDEEAGNSLGVRRAASKTFRYERKFRAFEKGIRRKLSYINQRLDEAQYAMVNGNLDGEFIDPRDVADWIKYIREGL